MEQFVFAEITSSFGKIIKIPNKETLDNRDEVNKVVFSFSRISLNLLKLLWALAALKNRAFAFILRPELSMESKTIEYAEKEVSLI